MKNVIISDYNNIIKQATAPIDKIKQLAQLTNGATFKFNDPNSDMSNTVGIIHVYFMPNYVFLSDEMKQNAPEIFIGTINEADILRLISRYDYNQKWCKGKNILFIDPYFITA